MTLLQTTSTDDRLRGLRAWQQEAFDLYFRREPRDFLTVATPGRGQDHLRPAHRQRTARQRRSIRAITVVTPTEHLKRQWADAAAQGRHPHRPGLQEQPGRHLRATTSARPSTYAQVATHPALHRARTEARKTLVIFDEIHHAGDA